MKPQGLDITDQLQRRLGNLCTENPDDYTAFTTYAEVLNAIDTIKQLRAALYLIGHDYVELSYDKVQHLYLEHMKIARDAYRSSFPVQPEKQLQPLDDNF
jgi:hypothetical protein